MNFYFYTETAFHHEGDLAFMLSLVDETVKAGAKGIKFQMLLQPEAFISGKHVAFKKISSCVFSETQWRKILDYTLTKGLDIICMPLDNGSFNLINQFKPHIKYVELHSVSFYDNLVKEKIKESGIPVIVGVGGRTLAEIREIADFFGSQLRVLMTGFQAFPSKLQDIKLRRIEKYRETFKSLKIGYADHSSFSDPFNSLSNDYAYLLGARVFEKHITTMPGKQRIDYESAVSGKNIASIIARLKVLSEDIVPDNTDEIFEMAEAEVKYRNRQRMAVAAKDLSAGTILTQNDVNFKLTDKSNGIAVWNLLGSKKLNKNVAFDEIITFEDLEDV